MISAIEVTDPMRSSVHWWDKVAWLKGRQRIDFKPGLNILWGPNGSGKSTVLTLIARMLHCEQGGVSCVTSRSIENAFTVAGTSRNGDRTETLPVGVVPVHDGQPAMHFDPSHAVGLECGGAAIDWDFSNMGIANTMFQGSSGQTVMMRINTILGAIIRPTEFPKTIEWKHPLVEPTERPTDKWRMKAWEVAQFLKGTIERGQPTVLLDEPDRSLSLKTQAGLWQNLAKRYAGNIQIIAASHSPLALKLPGANYIEIEPGYLAECERVMEMHALGFLMPAAPKAEPKASQ